MSTVLLYSIQMYQFLHHSGGVCMCSNGVVYLHIFVPVLRDVSRYVKVYPYFTVFWTKCVQYWEAITAITVHEFLLCSYN